MMDRNDDQSITSARALVSELPGLIARAEAGRLAIPAFMLRTAFAEARKIVAQAEGRCGRAAPADDFLGQLSAEDCSPRAPARR